MSFHPIQWLHLWNMAIGFTLFGILVTVSNNIKLFIENGSKLAGFGEFPFQKKNKNKRET